MRTEFVSVDNAHILELYDLDLPQPDVKSAYLDTAYRAFGMDEFGKRWSYELNNLSEIYLYFLNLTTKTIIPEIFKNKNSPMEYPWSADFIIKNCDVAISTSRDEIGWFQNSHIDNRSYIMTGIFHLQDSPNNGTAFHGSDRDNPILHKLPSMKNTGGVWLNDINTWHSLPSVKDTERMIYMLHIRWNLKY